MSLRASAMLLLRTADQKVRGQGDLTWHDIHNKLNWNLLTGLGDGSTYIRQHCDLLSLQFTYERKVGEKSGVVYTKENLSHYVVCVTSEVCWC